MGIDADVAVIAAIAGAAVFVLAFGSRCHTGVAPAVTFAPASATAVAVRLPAVGLVAGVVVATCGQYDARGEQGDDCGEQTEATDGPNFVVAHG
jgi:hypothetical protein